MTAERTKQKNSTRANEVKEVSKFPQVPRKHQNTKEEGNLTDIMRTKLLADSDDPDFNKDLEAVTRDVQELIKMST